MDTIIIIKLHFTILRIIIPYGISGIIVRGRGRKSIYTRIVGARIGLVGARPKRIIICAVNEDVRR